MPQGTRRLPPGRGIGGQAEPSLTGRRAAAQAGASEGYEDAARRVAESLPAVVHCRQPAVSFAYL